jgi:hypothetical protein
MSDELAFVSFPEIGQLKKDGLSTLKFTHLDFRLAVPLSNSLQDFERNILNAFELRLTPDDIVLERDTDDDDSETTHPGALAHDQHNTKKRKVDGLYSQMSYKALRQNGMKVLVRLANTNVLQGMKQAV